MKHTAFELCVFVSGASIGAALIAICVVCLVK